MYRPPEFNAAPKATEMVINTTKGIMPPNGNGPNCIQADRDKDKIQKIAQLDNWQVPCQSPESDQYTGLVRWLKSLYINESAWT